MSFRVTGQLGFADAAVEDVVVVNAALERVSAMIDWQRVEAHLVGLRDPGPGRPGFRPLVMFRSLLLANLYGLSDRELEFMLADRLSFKRFAGFALADGVPDHSVLCRFRNMLIERDLLDVLFEEINAQFDEAGLIVRKGTLVDATLFEGAAARPDRKEDAIDKDAAFVSRSGKGTVYGYKAHVGVDQGSGLIRRVITTPANVNDTTPADDLICGDEAAVYADKAYDTHARRADLKARGIKPRIMRRPNRHHPELPPRLKRYNALLTPLRAPVETTFATWKLRMGMRRGRYFGLIKTTGQILLTAIAFNLRRAAALTP
jgi:IS5 family transposase